MPHFYKHLNILVMPTDACNMNCVYCFHVPTHNSMRAMRLEVVERLFAITMPFYKRVNFLWHGGEPLLMGLDFYKQVLEHQKGYNCKINNSIQSNLTLMSPELAIFFKENGFDTSGSYDGVMNAKLRGNDEAILNGRQMIINHGGSCGFIMVVSRLNIHNLIDSYIFFRDKRINYSLNLYLDQKDCENPELRLDETETIKRLNELFIHWVYDVNGNIDISYFKRILKFILYKKKDVCTYTSCLGRWIGVRPDGTIVPCNRYFPNKYSFGNVFEYSDIGEAFESEGFVSLLSEAIARREKCKSCDIYDFCSGGCNNVAFNENGIENNGGISCKILLCVYKHVESFINSVTFSQLEADMYNPNFTKMMMSKFEHT